MGKRELLIVAAFVIIGAVAYHVTAPAPRAGQRGFSWSALRDAWRTQSRGPRGRGTATTSGTVPVGAGLSELAVSGVSTIEITGEPRADVAWTLHVESAATDDATAERAAQAVILQPDVMGSVLALAAHAPRESGPGTTLRLQVPRSLEVRLAGARKVTAAGLAALRLDNVTGDVNVREIAGAVSGSHRNGTIAIAGAGTVSLNLTSAGLTLGGVRGETTLTMRNGSARLSDLRGATTVDATNVAVDATHTIGPARFTTVQSTLSVTDPAGDVRIDARNAKVQIALGAAVPVTAFVTGGLRLALAGGLPITLDAIADGGTIVAGDVGLTPETNARGATLRHVFGTRAIVAIRSDGGVIVIAGRK